MQKVVTAPKKGQTHAKGSTRTKKERSARKPRYPHRKFIS